MTKKETQVRTHPVLHNVLLFTVFGFYLFILFSMLFLKSHSLRAVNLVPFRILDGDPLSRAFLFSNLMGNIALFLPLGVYLPLLRRDQRIWTNLVWVLLISTAAELTQYLFQVGVTDIDDVILNGLGGLLGILLYRLLLKLFKEKVRYAVEILAPVGGALSFLFLILYNL